MACFTASYVAKYTACAGPNRPRQQWAVQVLGIPNRPAPTITLDTPLHNDPNPSILDIVATAFERPVYRAAGDGLMICMRVWYRSAVHRGQRVKRY